MVILVDNVDKFVHNLIIGGFADFCHVENFLESFFTYPPWFDKFCAYCQNDLFRADIARIRTHLSNVANPLRFYIKPFFLQLFMVFLLRAVLTSALFFVNVKTLKQRVDFSVLNFFRHTICPIREDRLCGFYYAQKTRSVFRT